MHVLQDFIMLYAVGFFLFKHRHFKFGGAFFPVGVQRVYFRLQGVVVFRCGSALRAFFKKIRRGHFKFYFSQIALGKRYFRLNASYFAFYLRYLGALLRCNNPPHFLVGNLLFPGSPRRRAQGYLSFGFQTPDIIA